MEECKLTPEKLTALRQPFPVEKISFKVQTKPNDKGEALVVVYIDARDVMDRLDDVAGGEWSDIYSKAPSGGLECALTVLGVTRRDVGEDENKTEPEKSGYSDAFKRAAVKFGVGRFLYDMPKMWAKVDERGNNVYLKREELPRLRSELAKYLGMETKEESSQKTTSVVTEVKRGTITPEQEKKLVELYTERHPVKDAGEAQKALDANLKANYGKTLLALSTEEAAKLISRMVADKAKTAERASR